MAAIEYMLMGQNLVPQVRFPVVYGDMWVFGREGCPLTFGSEPDVGGAPFDLNWLETVEQDGATFNGRNDKVNTFTLDVICKNHDYRGDDAVALYLEWRGSLGRGEEQVVFQSGTTRGYRAQMVRLADVNPTLDLMGIYRRGSWREKVKFVVDQSYWFGEGESLYRQYADGFSGMEILNGGDRPAWWTASITGPVTNPSIGVDGEIVQLTGTTIPDGYTWEISTDPMDRYIRRLSDDANMAPLASQAAGRPIFWTKPLPVDRPGSLHFSGTGMNANTMIGYNTVFTHWGGVA